MITVKRESELEAQTWVFRYDQQRRGVSLLRWEMNARPSVRHKFRPSRTWWCGYAEAAPPVPPDVLDEAWRQFVEALRVEG